MGGEYDGTWGRTRVIGHLADFLRFVHDAMAVNDAQDSTIPRQSFRFL